MRLLRLTLPIALLALLSACVPTPAAAPTPTDAATEAPLFATDEEALAAAEEVYREYVEVSELIVTQGGSEPERIRPFVGDAWYESQLETYEELRLAGRHTSGPSEIVDFQLQAREGTELRAYACHDFANVKAVDASGADVTPDRPRYAVFLVSFELRGQGQLVTGSQLWEAVDRCFS
jgi:hypothetical protein